MATRTSPAAKPKKQKAPVTAIVLGTLCLALLAACTYFFVQYNGRTADTERLVSGLNQIAETTEMEPLPLEVWTDDLLAPEAMEELVGSVSAVVAARDEALAEREELMTTAAQVREEQNVTMQQLRESRSRAERLESDLTESRTERDRLQERHAEEQEALRAEVEQLTEELADTRERLAEATAEPEEGDMGGTADEAETADAAEPGMRADDAETDKGEAEVEVEDMEPIDMDRNLPDDASELFKRADYDAEAERLSLITVDGRSLVYREVPVEIYEALLAAPAFDIYYRINIMLNFPSEPDEDGELIRSLRR